MFITHQIVLQVGALYGVINSHITINIEKYKMKFDAIFKQVHKCTRVSTLFLLFANVVDSDMLYRCATIYHESQRVQ